MAYVILNKSNGLSFISKDMEQLEMQYPSYPIYQNGYAGSMVEISQADFTSLQLGEKVFSHDGTNIVLKDPKMIVAPPYNEEQLKDHFNLIKDRLKELIKGKPDSAWKTELSNYLNVLENFDLSTITYPLNISFEKHLSNQGYTVLSPLQLF